MSVDLTNKQIESLLPAVERIVGFIGRRNRLGRDESEDFASFVKLKLVEKSASILGGFRGRSSLETYLSVVVHRLFLDYRAIRQPKSVQDEPAAPEADDPLLAEEGRAAVARIEIALDDALAAMPAEDRLIVRLHFFERLNIAAVAEVLHLRQKPLYRRVDRILESLRDQLITAGIDPKTIASLIGHAEFGVGFRKNLSWNVRKRTGDPSMES